MISVKIARDQLGRLVRLQNFPSEDQCQKDLVKALRASDTERMCTEVVDAWIESNKFAPRPADIYELVKENRARTGVDDSKPPCSACAGIGYTIVERQHPLDSAMMITAAKPCAVCKGTGNETSLTLPRHPKERTPNQHTEGRGAYPD